MLTENKAEPTNILRNWLQAATGNLWTVRRQNRTLFQVDFERMLIVVQIRGERIVVDLAEEWQQAERSKPEISC